MAIKKYKPTSPGRRGMTVSTFEEVTTNEPYKPLTRGAAEAQRAERARPRHHPPPGRRHAPALPDHRFQAQQVRHSGAVQTIEYDPNRSARIALVAYADGEKRYILAPDGLKVGQTVQSGTGSPIRVGNSLPLREMPPGTNIHNIELKPGRGGQLVRSAGVAAQVVAKSEQYAQVRMPSGETRADLARLHRDARPGRQYRSRERRDRQGGAQPAEGEAAHGARLRDEPARPSTWRWRGQGADRRPAADAVGQARARLPHAP